MSDSDKLEELHNQGQTDAGKGEYNPPHDLVRTTAAAFLGGLEEMEAENEAYREGHAHTESQKSGCFLTTACARAAGLPDDCHELTVLRNFRDTYVRSLKSGEAMIMEYNRASPLIAKKLSANELDSIYTIVQHAVAQIDRGEFKEAFAAYAQMFSELRNKYVGQ